MKKKLAMVGLLVTVIMCGCGNSGDGTNSTIFGTLGSNEYNFTSAIIKLPDGDIISGDVSKWSTYNNVMVQVTIDGTTYMADYENCVLYGDTQ